MRRRFVVLLSLVSVLGLVAPATAVVRGPAAGLAEGLVYLPPGADSSVITSPNVTYHATIPVDSPGVGAKVVKVGAQTRLYVTGLKGLTIYDVTNPAVPVPLGTAAYPHSQNEAVSVSDDGKRVVISADGALLLPVMPATTGITIIDTSNPLQPQVVSRLNQSNHTAACADAKCEWIYGSGGGIYDATDPSDIKRTGSWNVLQNPDGTTTAIGGRHALNRDASGLLISDSQPRLVLDPREDPARPKVLTQGGRSSADSRLQHNNVRTDALAWQARDPRNPDDAVETVQIPPRTRSISVTDTRPVMREGELFIANSESNLNTGCSNAGGLSTWSMIDFDKGAPLQQLEVFRPLNGTWVDGSPAVNGLGCSGHWFTERGGYVTASWYEHGVRFFKVDKTTGTIDEVGFFQPVATEAGAAHWINDEYVYSIDYARGIDIVRFDRDAPEPTQQQLDASWLANLGRVGELASRERYLCELGVRQA